ncbi:uncharacterized protein LOC105848645 [Hydra vulgaris]|uniref:uncharacterized protein LOC105848645 n=1 Tax=Hydra vulgaris TaxID=6087 RepID=UPI001F5F318E|nr:uncharacterized protein LOC105848645 [Hydra vulgaris]
MLLNNLQSIIFRIRKSQCQTWNTQYIYHMFKILKESKKHKHSKLLYIILRIWNRSIARLIKNNGYNKDLGNHMTREEEIWRERHERDFKKFFEEEPNFISNENEKEAFIKIIENNNEYIKRSLRNDEGNE